MGEKPSHSQQAQGSYIAQVTGGGTASVQVVLPPPAIQERNRVRFLKRLRVLYEDLWEQSLQGAARLTLGLTDKPDVVLHHTELLLRAPQLPEYPLPEGTTLLKVFDEAGQELLLLGEPGAGKSTLLLELARQLVEHAEQDAVQPLPVIIPLSTWAVKRQPLTDWLSEQLTQLYDLPRRLSYAWVQTDQILPLLDGLDEVPQEARVACIQAINSYHKEHLVPLVVCSRRVEYEEIPPQQRLVMQSAVVVQPLTREQVEGYLLQGGEALTVVRAVLHTNPVLQELITTPLMLHLLMLTYAGASACDLPRSGTAQEQQQIIFARYTEHMIERKKTRIRFPLQRIIPWLSWLARQMCQHNQAVFYLEQLQPDWLSGTWMVRAYDRLAIQVPNVLIGMLVSLAISAMFAVLSRGPDLVMSLLLGGLLGGLLSRGGTTQRPVTNGGKARSIPWQQSLQRLLVGILISLGIGLSYGLSNSLAEGLSVGLCSTLLQVLLVKSNIVLSPSQILPPVGRTKWQHLIRSIALHNGLLVGLSSWLIFGLAEGLSQLRFGPVQGLRYGLSHGLIFGLSFGLSTGVLSLLLIDKSMTVQLTDRLILSWKSLGRSLQSSQQVRAALQVAALVGLILVLSVGLSYGLSVGLRQGLSEGLRYGLIIGLSYGLSVGLLLGLSCWLLIGLFQGVSSEAIGDQQRLVPNQGIRRSAFNGLVLGLVSAMIGWLILGLSVGLSRVLSYGLLWGTEQGLRYGLLEGLRYGLSEGLNVGLRQGLSEGLRYGLIFGLSAGLSYGLLKGGLACLRHYVLRFLLWRREAIPWHYVRFLDETTDCILLRRVGGGYSFAHRLLLDYFADLEPPALTATATQPPPAMKVP